MVSILTGAYRCQRAVRVARSAGARWPGVRIPSGATLVVLFVVVVLVLAGAVTLGSRHVVWHLIK